MSSLGVQRIYAVMEEKLVRDLARNHENKALLLGFRELAAGNTWFIKMTDLHIILEDDTLLPPKTLRSILRIRNLLCYKWDDAGISGYVTKNSQTGKASVFRSKSIANLMLTWSKILWKVLSCITRS